MLYFLLKAQRFIPIFFETISVLSMLCTFCYEVPVSHTRRIRTEKKIKDRIISVMLALFQNGILLFPSYQSSSAIKKRKQ